MAPTTGPDLISLHLEEKVVVANIKLHPYVRCAVNEIG